MTADKKSEIDQLRDEYSDNVEFEHGRLLVEIGKTASRGLSGNVGFVAKQQARHHIIKGLMKR